MRTAKLLTTTALAAVLAGTAARADVTISKKPTQNMSCVARVCSPTASNAVLNVNDLTDMLASGDVKVTTGSGATNILVKDTLGWTSTRRLTLDAIQSVEIDKPVMVTGTGAVTVTTNDGGKNGDLIFGDKGNVTFWDLASSLIVNANSYTLVGNIATLASDIANNPSGFYALANDYDASVNGTYSSAPITTELTGTFEGLGHKISNLKIISSDLWIGFFANANGTLRDIGLIKVSVGGSGTIGGSLLGESRVTNIIGCYATGSIMMNNGVVVGGLVGQSGATPDGLIVRSYANVDINAPVAAAAGGLVGESVFDVMLSYAVGRVRVGDNAWAGGLVGVEAGSITQSYATGGVTAGERSALGGLVGDSSSEIDNSYATGEVKGGTNSQIGGFLGLSTGHVESSYSTGLVKGKKTGGFSGSGRGGLSLDYWDTDTSGKGKGAGCGGSGCGRGAKGLTTEKFQSGLPDGFDPAIWGQNKNINGGYPYLIANPPK